MAGHGGEAWKDPATRGAQVAGRRGQKKKKGEAALGAASAAARAKLAAGAISPDEFGAIAAANLRAAAGLRGGGSGGGGGGGEGGKSSGGGGGGAAGAAGAARRKDLRLVRDIDAVGAELAVDEWRFTASTVAEAEAWAVGLRDWRDWLLLNTVDFGASEESQSWG